MGLLVWLARKCYHAQAIWANMHRERKPHPKDIITNCTGTLLSTSLWSFNSSIYGSASQLNYVSMARCWNKSHLSDHHRSSTWRPQQCFLWFATELHIVGHSARFQWIWFAACLDDTTVMRHVSTVSSLKACWHFKCRHHSKNANFHRSWKSFQISMPLQNMLPVPF